MASRARLSARTRPRPCLPQGLLDSGPQGGENCLTPRPSGSESQPIRIIVKGREQPAVFFNLVVAQRSE